MRILSTPYHNHNVLHFALTHEYLSLCFIKGRIEGIVPDALLYCAYKLAHLLHTEINDAHIRLVCIKSKT